VHILGHKIKVEGDDPACGVWFVNQADNSRTKITEHLAVNRTSELVGVIPPLTAGTYRLEVVTQFSSGSFVLKDPRTITVPVVLTVA
jgi:hypothetical protein